MRNDRGFTLLEVLVSVTIIAVLTAIGVVSYSSVNKRSRDVKRKSDMEQLRSALEMYKSDNTVEPGQYPHPNALGSWVNVSDLSTTLVDTYTPAIPTDPNSDTAYMYRALTFSLGGYYSYCICAKLENPPATGANTCGIATLYSGADFSCNYGIKSP